MNYEVVDELALKIVEWTRSIEKIGDASDVVAACYEQDTHRLLIASDRLPSAFFDLRSLFAGEFVQKLQNYQLRVALVIANTEKYGERFEEFAREARHGRHVCVVASRETALSWLQQE